MLALAQDSEAVSMHDGLPSLSLSLSLMDDQAEDILKTILVQVWLKEYLYLKVWSFVSCPVLWRMDATKSDRSVSSVSTSQQYTRFSRAGVTESTWEGKRKRFCQGEKKKAA